MDKCIHLFFFFFLVFDYAKSNAIYLLTSSDSLMDQSSQTLCR